MKLSQFNICICGIGYVGLTLAVVMAEQGFSVYGAEIKQDVIESLNRGEPHFHEKGLRELLQKHLGTRLEFGQTIPKRHFDAHIVSVGTPLLPLTQEPDLQYLMNVTEQLAQDILDDSLIILRSTVPIGTTRSIVLPILQRRYADVKIAFCPERTVEGHALAELTSLPQIIGGLEQESIDRAAQIFEKITPHIVRVSSLETAEMVKLLDNSFRDLNFAYANQVAEIAPRFGVDAMEAITCANQGYNRNRIPVPGFVGGACLEKDPHILTYCTKNRGYDSSLIRIGRAIHERLPVTVVARVRQLLQDFGKPPQTAKIFLTGLAFKGEPETDDLRGSPSRIIVKALHEAGFSAVYVHDFVVPYDSLKTWDVIPVTIEEGFKSADAIIIANNHARYKSLPIRELLSTSNLPVILYDSWRIFSKDDLDAPGIHYEGLGFQKL